MGGRLSLLMSDGTESSTGSAAGPDSIWATHKQAKRPHSMDGGTQVRAPACKYHCVVGRCRHCFDLECGRCAELVRPTLRVRSLG